MKQNILYRLMRGAVVPLMHLVYAPRILGRRNIPAEGPVILAGNHKHALDPILVDICTKRTVCTLAKKELHDGPFGWFFRAVGTIPVDLHAPKNGAALEAAVEALLKGSAVNVSPEAKRNYTDELLLPFKYGAAAMAHRTGAPIVPYAIAGQYKRGRLTIAFGKPFYPDGGDLTRTNKRLYNRIAALLRQITDKQELEQKHFTAFEKWSEQ